MHGGARDPRSEAQIDGTVASVFGKYQLFASLGRGGMADVFLAVARGQMGFNKLAVVKRLKPALAEETAFRTMFLDEARLAARLSHPNIVNTYDVGEQYGVYFIAMEYLEGQSLNKVIKEAARRREVIGPEVGVRIIADALAGLGYAHDLRDYDGRPLDVIHRDVSPHNIFVTYDGHTKLVDFGIAKAALSTQETEVGVLKGKVAYMSPEQAIGDRIDARSDLFAMGIVLWELIAQERLMTGESAANTLHRLMNDPIPRLSEVVPGIDPELDAIVARALEKDPNRRWQSAAEMRSVLESWLEAQPFHARQEDVSRRMVGLFGHVREDIQIRIQQHMAAITNAQSTQELQALTAESLKRMEQAGAKVSGHLLSLAAAQASGGASGIVPSYGALPSSPSMYPALQTGPHQPQPARASSALMIVIAIGCFLLAGLLIVVIGLRDRGDTPPSLAVPASVKPIDPAPSETPSATVTATATAPASVTSTAPSVPPKQHPHVGPARAPAQPAKTPPPPTAEEPGFVTMSAYPWAKVSEGSKVVCAVTPCNKVSMSAGAHTLTFENGESPGQKQTVVVQVKSGETSTKNVGFK
jgi:serine/threonine-protein kinase